MTARNWNWSVGDRVVEFLDGAGHIGTVASTGDRLLAIRFDGGGRAGFRHPHNPHLIPAAEVLRVARALLDEEVPDAEPRLVISSP